MHFNSIFPLRGRFTTEELNREIQRFFRKTNANSVWKKTRTAYSGRDACSFLKFDMFTIRIPAC